MGVIVNKVEPNIEYSAAAAAPLANAARCTFAGQHVLNTGAIVVLGFLALITDQCPLTIDDLEDRRRVRGCVDELCTGGERRLSYRGHAQARLRQ